MKTPVPICCDLSVLLSSKDLQFDHFWILSLLQSCHILCNFVYELWSHCLQSLPGIAASVSCSSTCRVRSETSASTQSWPGIRKVQTFSISLLHTPACLVSLLPQRYNLLYALLLSIYYIYWTHLSMYITFIL